MTRRRSNDFTNATKAKAYLRDGGRCVLCTRKVGVGGEQAEYDHIKPVWEGGDNSLENCRTLCAHCHQPVTKEQAGQRSEARRHQKKMAGIKPRKRVILGSKASPLKKKVSGEVVRR